MTSIFQASITGLQEIAVRVTTDDPTVIADATDTVLFVPWFQVNEINGGTHTLTVDLYDGTNAVFLGDDTGFTWNIKAVTADASYPFTQGLIIPKGSQLRVTSGDSSGYFHVQGIFGKPY